MTPQAATRRFCIVMVLNSFGAGLPMGINVLLAQARGVTLVQIGLLLAIHSATAVVLEVPTGGLADAWGRKNTLLLSFGTSGIAMVTMTCAFSFGAFATAMVLSGAARALLSGAGEALLVETLQDAGAGTNLQKGLSIVWLMSAFGTALGGCIGGFLPQWFMSLPPGGSVMVSRLTVPFLCSVVVSVVSILSGLALLPAHRKASDAARESIPHAMARIVRESVAFSLANRPVLLLMIGIALLAFGFCAIEAFRQPRLAQLLENTGSGTGLFGALFAGSLIASGIGAVLGGPLSNWMNRKYALTAAVTSALLGASVITLSLQRGVAGTLSVLLFVFLIQGALGPVLQALFNNAIPSDKRATMLSLLSVCMQLGVLAGGIVFGTVGKRLGLTTAWTYGGISLLGLVPLFIYLNNLDRLAAPLPAEGENVARPLPSETGAT